MYRAWQTSWYAWKNATETLLIPCTQKLVCAGAVFFIGTTSRSCSCADLLVRISAVHESHGYLGPDLINMTRELRRVDTEKGRFAVTVYLLAIWKRSQPISSEGSMKVWNNAQVQRFLLQNCSLHRWTERVESPLPWWADPLKPCTSLRF